MTVLTLYMGHKTDTTTVVFKFGAIKSDRPSGLSEAVIHLQYSLASSAPGDSEGQRPPNPVSLINRCRQSSADRQGNSLYVVTTRPHNLSIAIGSNGYKYEGSTLNKHADGAVCQTRYPALFTHSFYLVFGFFAATSCRFFA